MTRSLRTKVAETQHPRHLLDITGLKPVAELMDICLQRSEQPRPRGAWLEIEIQFNMKSMCL